MLITVFTTFRHFFVSRIRQSSICPPSPSPIFKEQNEKCTKYFNLNGSEKFKELGVDGIIILRQTKKEGGGMDSSLSG
jgi:hypothetical protein